MRASQHRSWIWKFTIGVTGAVLLTANFLAFGTLYAQGAQQSQPRTEKRWNAKYVSGTEKLANNSKVTIRLQKEEIVCNRGGSLAFTIPVAQITNVVHGSRSLHPVSEFFGQAAGNANEITDLPGAMLAMGLALATSGIKIDEMVIGLSWKETDNRGNAILILKKADGEKLLNELRRVTGREPSKVADGKTEEVDSVLLALVEAEAASEKRPEEIPESPLVLPAAPSAPFQVTFKKIFDDVGGVSMFDSDGDRVYLVDGKRVRVIDANSSSLLLSKTLSELPCPKSRIDVFDLWRSLPNQKHILAHSCGTLLLMDKLNFVPTEHGVYTGLDPAAALAMNTAVSSQGDFVAFSIPIASKPSIRLVLLDVKKEVVAARWLLDSLPRMTFNSEGTLLVTAERDYEKGCTVRSYQVPTGKLHAQFSLTTSLAVESPCDASALISVAGHPELIASLHQDRMILNITTGKVVQQEHYNSSAAGELESSFLTSNGEMLILAADKRLVFREPLTGEVLYDSASSSPEILTSSDKLRVSNDGRYLLTDKALYEIVKQEPGKPSP